MSLRAHTEVEVKLDVGPGAVVPSPDDLPGVASVDAPTMEDLEADYLDTEQLDLARAGITLRRRTGGTDAGWHLKLPLGGSARQELRHPLGTTLQVPDALLDWTGVVRRDRPLVPVARISTHREVHRLRDARGRVLAEVADDRVRGTRLPAGPRTSWREWEVELVEGPPELLDRCAALLREAGAVPARTPSKLARVLGDAASDRRDPLPAPTAREVLGAYLGAQTTQLRREDPLVRAGAPDSVHKTRVAARRARSAVASFAPVLEPGSWQQLAEDLRWLGLTLGEARDAEVLALRMQALLTGVRESSTQQAVSRRIDAELTERRMRGEAQVRTLLDSERYHRLVDALDRFADAPPTTAAAGGPGPAVVAGLVAGEWKRLRRRVRKARTTSGADRDDALHDVRKAAKRLRYVSEAAVPVLGDPARTLAASSAVLQDTLGEHHDVVVARALLRRVHQDLGSGRSTDKSLDRLHAEESARARGLEKDYEVAIAAVMRDHPGRWLREASDLAAHLSGGEPRLEAP